MAGVCTKVDQAADAANKTVYTWTGRALGAAAADRMIVVCPAARKGGAASSISSVTIGGVSATEVIQVSNVGEVAATISNGVKQGPNSPSALSVQ
jgi:hypothetical protein